MEGITKLDARGWKEITKLVGCKDPRTAKKIIKKTGLLCYQGTTPVVNIEAYRLYRMRQHKEKPIQQPTHE